MLYIRSYNNLKEIDTLDDTKNLMRSSIENMNNNINNHHHHRCKIEDIVRAIQKNYKYIW